MNTIKVVIQESLSEDQQNYLLTLAEKLHLPVTGSIPEDADGYLLFDNAVLCLQYRKTETGKFHNLSVKFNEGKNSYRLAKNCTIKQPIAKAVGIKPGFRPNILDVTAGLGQDSFVFASLGCKVIMIERSPILHALLADGLERAKFHPATSSIVNNNLCLHYGDSISLLAQQNLSAHTVYLDPMYPGSEKSALNKIEMRIIREIVGDDTDSAQLLSLACGCAENRVVVKRPKRAQPISSEIEPSFGVEMKNSRFDIYLTRKPAP